MERLDAPIRSPTGSAWLTSAVAVILTGESFYEMRKPEAAEILHVPFADSELLGMAIVCGLAAVLALVWLVSLYVSPGHLIIDGVAGKLQRIRRRYVRRLIVDAPLGEWNVRLVFFSDEHRDSGVFKRIELEGPDFSEVLLFADLRHGEQLARALESVSSALGRFDVDVQKSARELSTDTDQS